MHDQVGVAADRRGEVGVAAQVQAEMADIVGRVDRLRLGAQHHLVDDVCVRAALARSQDAVEVARRATACALGEAAGRASQEVAQRSSFSLRGRVVHAVDQRACACALQRLGGGDIGLDHELFDQLVRLEPLARAMMRRLRPSASSMILRSGRSRSSGSRRSRAARERGVGGPQRLEDRLQQRLGLRRAGGRRSRPAPPRRRAWRPSASGRATKRVALLVAVAVEHHAHDQAGAVLAFAQRAQIGGQLLRQHRHDAVGEIDGVAALAAPRGRAPSPACT